MNNIEFFKKNSDTWTRMLEAEFEYENNKFDFKVS